MITKEKGQEIKKIVGYRYAQKFLAFFKAQGYYREDGEEYSESAVRDWVRGREDVSPRIEGFCLEAVEHFTRLYAKAKENRDRILNKVKEVQNA